MTFELRNRTFYTQKKTMQPSLLKTAALLAGLCLSVMTASAATTNFLIWDGTNTLVPYTPVANRLPADPGTNLVLREPVDGLFSWTNQWSRTTNQMSLSWIYVTNQVTHAKTLVDMMGGYQWICPTGYSTFYNPFINTDDAYATDFTNNYAVSSFLQSAPNGLYFYTYNAASSNWTLGTMSYSGTWTVPNFQLSPHRPLLVRNTSGNWFTNFFFGTIQTGDYTVKLKPGMNFVCTPIFRERERLTELGGDSNIVPAENDSISLIKVDGTWDTTYYQVDEGGDRGRGEETEDCNSEDPHWTPITGRDVSLCHGPMIAVRQCFFYFNAQTTTNNWTSGAHFKHIPD